MQVYEVRPRKDHRGIDLISDVLPFGPAVVWRADAISNAVGYAKSTVDHVMRSFAFTITLAM
jgi:hypothetical protein